MAEENTAPQQPRKDRSLSIDPRIPLFLAVSDSYTRTIDGRNYFCFDHGPDGYRLASSLADSLGYYSLVIQEDSDELRCFTGGAHLSSLTFTTGNIDHRRLSDISYEQLAHIVQEHPQLDYRKLADLKDLETQLEREDKIHFNRDGGYSIV